MKRFLSSLLLFTLTFWIAAPSAMGVIIVIDPDPRHPIIIVPPPRPHPPIPWPRPIPQPHVFAPLEITSLSGTVKIKDQVAVTTIDQEFYNPNPRQMEGTFLFPVPQGAAISKFTMEIGGKPVQAELLPADKAKKIYEDIVRSMKDPALLEYSGLDVYKLRIFPIEPNGRKRISLTYTQVLKNDGGLVSYQYPLNTAKYSAKPIPNVSFKVEIDSKRPIKSIYSPSHNVEVKRDGASRAVVGFEAQQARPDANFQLYFSPEKSDVAVNLLTHRTGEGEGFFLLLASPGVDVSDKQIVQKDVVFVIDTSGSMAGAKLEQAKKALTFCVENLNENDRFEVIRFATEAEALFGSLTDAKKANRDKARDHAKELKPIGGTAIDDALRKALGYRPAAGDRPFVVIFLTDGRPTVGETNEDKIHANIKNLAANTRVFCFGIGTDVNSHLLDKIAETTRAFTQYVLAEEDIEVKVSAFFTKIKEPVLANPSLKFPDSVKVSKMYPNPLPDLFKGEELILAGRYTTGSKGHILLEGTVNGQKKQFEYPVDFPGTNGENEFIPRLWATRRVGYLLDEIRLRGESKELKDEVADLARQYGIVTPYTAYLILEDEARRNVPVAMQSFRELQGNREFVQAQAEEFRAFKNDRGGEKGVGAARSSIALKDAKNATDGVYRGNLEAVTVGKVPAAPGFGGGAAGAPNSPVNRARQAESAGYYQQQMRWSAGKNFYQNGDQWIDAEVQQQKAGAPRVRVQFGTPDYFDLIAKNPQSRQWLANGRNVQFVLKGTIYEVAE
ncbi:MAG: VWA domain-containing protein [Pedosphaera sp.]|nr:VWA domain-containing protein [Pedosphaera sp.]